ncbi:MAG: alpha/beta hydrolase [Anaerolineae bacterium]|nr:alpha/beta hydrolase [Anaerolineae bacterium]
MTNNIKQHKIRTAVHYAHTHAETNRYLLSKVAHEKELAHSITLESFQQETGLADFYWETTFYQHPYHQRPFAQALSEAEGYIFFLHGWDGSHRIWEELPLQLAVKNKRLICYNLDVNGFGASPFITDPPSPEQCSPAGLIAAVDLWLRAIDLWPSPNPSAEKRPFYLFIGHSMSGAALFYKDLTGWQNERYGFYALAPALFYNDVQRRAFFKTMGLVGVKLPPSLNAIKNSLAPHIIEILGNGASPEVKSEHLRIYNQTPFGTVAQVIYAMGMAANMPQHSDWSRFRVALGHKDKVVNVNNTLNLLDELGFNSEQIKVMLGDHYFFSWGDASPASHRTNQQLLFNDILAFCHDLSEQKSHPPTELYATPTNSFMPRS